MIHFLHRLNRCRSIALLALCGALFALLIATPAVRPTHAALQSTDTPTPTPVVLTPKLGSRLITAQNAAHVSQLMEIGYGGPNAVCWSPDGKTLAVASTIGLWLYDAFDWSKPPTHLGPETNLSGCGWSPSSQFVTLINSQKSSAVPWTASIWKASDGTAFKSFPDVSAVSWSPDSKYFATTDADGYSRLWNGSNGQVLGRHLGISILWSTDSQFCALIDGNKVIRVWAAATNSIVFNDSSGWNKVLWSPNSQWLAALDKNGAVGLAAVNTQKSTVGRIVPLIETGWNDFSWSPDSTQLATAGKDGRLVLWNVADGQQANSFIFRHPILTVMWSPTGQTIALGIDFPEGALYQPDLPNPAYLDLIDAKTGKTLFDTSQYTNTIVLSLSWSPIGRYLSMRYSQQGEGGPNDYVDITFVNNSATYITTLPDQPFDWSPDDNQIASISLRADLYTNDYGTIRIHNLTVAQSDASAEVELLNDATNSPFVAWSPNGQYLAWLGIESQRLGSGLVQLWRITDGVVSNPCCHVARFVWGMDSNVIAISGVGASTGVEVIVDTITETSDPHLAPDGGWVIGIPFDNLPHQLALSPDLRYLAFDNGNFDGPTFNIYLWQLREDKLFETLTGHTSHVNSVAFSPDGQYLASGSDDKTIRIWDVASGHTVEILNGANGSIRHVAWSPDGTLLVSGGDDKTVQILDVGNGVLQQTLQGHTASVVSVQWSPDGKLVASASQDGTIKIWNVSNGKLLTTLTGHVGAINDLSWSPDGKTLASAGADATIRLWGVP